MGGRTCGPWRPSRGPPSAPSTPGTGSGGAPPGVAGSVNPPPPLLRPTTCRTRLLRRRRRRSLASSPYQPRRDHPTPRSWQGATPTLTLLRPFFFLTRFLGFLLKTKRRVLPLSFAFPSSRNGWHATKSANTNPLSSDTRDREERSPPPEGPKKRLMSSPRCPDQRGKKSEDSRFSRTKNHFLRVANSSQGSPRLPLTCWAW